MLQCFAQTCAKPESVAVNLLDDELENLWRQLQKLNKTKVSFEAGTGERAGLLLSDVHQIALRKPFVCWSDFAVVADKKKKNIGRSQFGTQT